MVTLRSARLLYRRSANFLRKEKKKRNLHVLITQANCTRTDNHLQLFLSYVYRPPCLFSRQQLPDSSDIRRKDIYICLGYLSISFCSVINQILTMRKINEKHQNELIIYDWKMQEKEIKRKINKWKCIF